MSTPEKLLTIFVMSGIVWLLCAGTWIYMRKAGALLPDDITPKQCQCLPCLGYPDAPAKKKPRTSPHPD